MPMVYEKLELSKMNERDIFMMALQREDPAERLACVAEACNGDEVLRRSVEALLAVHERAAGFLAGPAVGAPAPLDRPPVADGPGPDVCV